MAGQLFRELAEGLSISYEKGCLLLTGHPDTLAMKRSLSNKLQVESAPVYDRTSKFKRFLSWFKYLAIATKYIVTSKRYDGFLVVSNPPILGGWFWLINRLNRRPYVVLVYDVHPDILVMMGVIARDGFIAKIWHMINTKVYNDASEVITIGKYMAKRIARNYPYNQNRLHVISPWVDVGRIKPIAYDDNLLLITFNPGRKKVVLYSGNMGISHDIDSMLEAAKLLQDRKDILFIFIGGGEKWQTAVDFSQKNNLNNISVYPLQPENKLPMSMALATISLVSLDVGAEELMVPSKVFYYMAAGSAVVGICNVDNELRDIIEGNGCGYCVKPNDPNTLAKIILNLLVDENQLAGFKYNARSAAKRKYSKQIGVGIFSTVLHKK